MNTTDTALKEMYDAFALCKTNKSKVKFLEDHKESGLYKDYDIKWDGRDEKGHDLPTGVYFIKFAAGTYIETQKVVLLK